MTTKAATDKETDKEKDSDKYSGLRRMKISVTIKKLLKSLENLEQTIDEIRRRYDPTYKSSVAQIRQ